MNLDHQAGWQVPLFTEQLAGPITVLLYTVSGVEAIELDDVKKAVGSKVKHNYV